VAAMFPGNQEEVADLRAVCLPFFLSLSAPPWIREAFAGKDHAGHEFFKKPFVLFPEEEREAEPCQNAEEVLLCEESFCRESLRFRLRLSSPRTALTENVAYYQKSPFLQDPRKFVERR